MLDFEAKKNESFAQIRKFCELDNSQITRIEDFVLLLLKENNNFNLIGKSTISDIWDRHILDSAQILKYLDDKDAKIADIGTGAGFPGVVTSILGVKETHLIEKSVRKCEFLQKAKILSSNRIFIHQTKLEEITDRKFDVITSRALASLDKLLGYALNLLDKNGYCLFLKGRKLERELLDAKKNFNFQYESFNSLTSSDSKIIKISNINKK